MRLSCIFAVLSAALLLLGGDVAAGSGGFTNGPILFQTTRPPGDTSASTIWQVNGDGSGLIGPVSPAAPPDCSSCFNSSQPAFSPDGTKVAFETSVFAASTRPALAVMNPDGSDVRLVVSHSDVHNCFENGQPTWSPDGTELAFSTCEGGFDPTLEVVHVDGTNLHVVAHFSSPDGYRYNHPSWSPDGTKIAYARPNGSGQEDIFTIRPDGTGETDLGVSGFGPAWSPDGSKIAFYRNTLTESGIWVMDADGTSVTRVTSSGDVHPTWSPDGTKIAFASSRARDGFQIYTMNADGSDQTRITDLDHGDTWPTWGRAPSQDVTITDCDDPRTASLGSVSGNLTIDTTACSLDLGMLRDVAGNVTITNTSGGNLSLSAVNLSGAGDVQIINTSGGNLALSAVNLSGSGSVQITSTGGGNLALTTADPFDVIGDVGVVEDGNVDVHTIAAGGDESLTSNGGSSVSGRTAGGTTTIAMLGGVAGLHATIPSGAFATRVPFTIERQGDEPVAPGLDAGGTPAIVDPIAGYHFTFAVPTLNADAQLAFTVDLTRLDAPTRAALLANADSATIAVRGDGPGSVYQAFARCTPGQTPLVDHCVDVTQDGDIMRFDGVAGHFSDYAVALVTPSDTTPPQIDPMVTGTLGGTGFYTSDVTVAWNVSDAESAIASRSGCDTSTLTADTTGITFTCTATSAGGTASRSVTIARDATAPSVTYSGNAGTYAVDQGVAITCTANDPTPGSGLASSTCPGASGPAYSFGAGQHTLSATAKDAAGNQGAASTTFTVAVTSGGVCRLTYAFVSGSAAYKRLPPFFRSLVDGTVQSVCNALDQVVPRLTATQKAQLIAGYKRGLQGLELLGYLTSSQATTLGQLASAV